MISDAELPRRSEHTQDRILSFGFWGLTVIVLLNLQYLSLWGVPGVRTTGFLAILGHCLLLLVLGAPRSLKEMGTSTKLISATLVCYLVIGVVASFAAHVERQPDFGRDVLRQTFFLSCCSPSRSAVARYWNELRLKHC